MEDKPLLAGSKSMLSTGTYIDVFNKAEWNLLSLRDIIIPLSNKIRFNGNFIGVSTVLSHSLNVAKMVEKSYEEDPSSSGHSDEELSFRILIALLHDAHEAIFFDIPSPMKGNPCVGGLVDIMKEFDDWFFHKIISYSYEDLLEDTDGFESEFSLQYSVIKKYDYQDLKDEWDLIIKNIPPKDKPLVDYYLESNRKMVNRLDVIEEYILMLKKHTEVCGHILSVWFKNEVKSL